MEPVSEPAPAALQPRRSTERRLRKMSQEFPPTAFSFHVQARVLCVGATAVYRVAITMTTTPTSAVAPPGPASSPSSAAAAAAASPNSSCQAWVIAMSQSKVRTFYSQVRAILALPSVRACCERERERESDSDRDGDEWKPFERFLCALEDVLRQHERLQTAAFAIPADAAAMLEGNAALEAFLTDCWSALEAVIPSLVVEPHLPAAALGREVLSIFVLRRDFLAFPERILEANSVYASAILSLEDVEELIPTVSDQACSICLESLALADTRELDPEAAATTDADSSSDAESGPSPGAASASSVAVAAPSQSAESAFSVKLPCAHLFHENCIMAWLRHNQSCPECRASVGVQ